MNQKGFTLIETLTVIGLILLLASLSIAFSFQYLQRQQLRAAAEIILTELRGAQTASLAQVDDADHGIAVFPSNVVRFTGPNYENRDVAKDRTVDFPYLLTTSNDSEVVFPKGEFRLDRDYTITIATASETYHILISQYGVLEIQEGTN